MFSTKAIASMILLALDVHGLQMQFVTFPHASTADDMKTHAGCQEDLQEAIKKVRNDMETLRLKMEQDEEKLRNDMRQAEAEASNIHVPMPAHGTTQTCTSCQGTGRYVGEVSYIDWQYDSGPCGACYGSGKMSFSPGEMQAQKRSEIVSDALDTVWESYRPQQAADRKLLKELDMQERQLSHQATELQRQVAEREAQHALEYYWVQQQEAIAHAGEDIPLGEDQEKRTYSAKCTYCDGDGYIWNGDHACDCHECLGKGTVQLTKTIRVTREDKVRAAKNREKQQQLWARRIATENVNVTSSASYIHRGTNFHSFYLSVGEQTVRTGDLRYTDFETLKRDFFPGVELPGKYMFACKARQRTEREVSLPPVLKQMIAQSYRLNQAQLAEFAAILSANKSDPVTIQLLLLGELKK